MLDAHDDHTTPIAQGRDDLRPRWSCHSSRHRRATEARFGSAAATQSHPFRSRLTAAAAPVHSRHSRQRPGDRVDRRMEPAWRTRRMRRIGYGVLGGLLLAAALPATAFAAEEIPVNSGNTAWLLISTAL